MKNLKKNLVISLAISCSAIMTAEIDPALEEGLSLKGDLKEFNKKLEGKITTSGSFGMRNAMTMYNYNNQILSMINTKEYDCFFTDADSQKKQETSNSLRTYLETGKKIDADLKKSKFSFLGFRFRSKNAKGLIITEIKKLRENKNQFSTLMNTYLLEQKKIEILATIDQTIEEWPRTKEKIEKILEKNCLSANEVDAIKKTYTQVSRLSHYTLPENNSKNASIKEIHKQLKAFLEDINEYFERYNQKYDGFFSEYQTSKWRRKLSDI